jgi:hypothetical protein
MIAAPHVHVGWNAQCIDLAAHPKRVSRRLAASVQYDVEPTIALRTMHEYDQWQQQQSMVLVVETVMEAVIDLQLGVLPDLLLTVNVQNATGAAAAAATVSIKPRSVFLRYIGAGVLLNQTAVRIDNNNSSTTEPQQQQQQQRFSVAMGTLTSTRNSAAHYNQVFVRFTVISSGVGVATANSSLGAAALEFSARARLSYGDKDVLRGKSSATMPVRTEKKKETATDAVPTT